jgi:hypothetical protein
MRRRNKEKRKWKRKKERKYYKNKTNKDKQNEEGKIIVGVLRQTQVAQAQ